MNNFNGSNEIYSFHYSDGEDRSINCSFSPGDTWPEVLEQFVSFMNNVYGYDIRDQVAIERRPFFPHDEWTGPVFDPEDCL